jgi:hypothetical protein
MNRIEELLDRLENMAENWRLAEKYDPVWFPGIREPRLDGNDCSKELRELIEEYRNG